MTRCSKLRACRVGGAIEAGLSIRYSALDFQDPDRCRSLACTVVVQKEDAMHRSASRQPFARTARMGFLRPTGSAFAVAAAATRNEDAMDRTRREVIFRLHDLRDFFSRRRSRC